MAGKFENTFDSIFAIFYFLYLFLVSMKGGQYLKICYRGLLSYHIFTKIIPIFAWKFFTLLICAGTTFITYSSNHPKSKQTACSGRYHSKGDLYYSMWHYPTWSECMEGNYSKVRIRFTPAKTNRKRAQEIDAIYQ